MILDSIKTPKAKTILALALPVQIALVKWIGNYPDFVEQYYSKGTYPVVSQMLRTLLGWIPFSIGDIFYLGLFVLVVSHIFKHRKTIKKKPLLFLKDIAVFLSIVFFAFHLLWGMNYYRKPIHEKFGIQREYEVTELIGFTKYLAEKTNQYQHQLAGDTATAVKIPYSRAEIFKKTEAGYASFKESFPDFEYKRSSLKASLFSLPLTYMGYGGYLNPFTNEAHVNGLTPLFRLPTVSGHEVGHQLGYAAEGATNFIGFLVTEQHEDPYFKYAAYHHALGYCLSDLQRKDEEASKEIIALLNPGVKKNFQELKEFWEKYQNPLEPMFKFIFSTFLKANNQDEGIQSYQAVVAYMVNYHKNNSSRKTLQ
ncbi:DUF3810 domain-containing protein [Flagellimonas meishanensis]|uniref:DUF3810 domain-containing protein n=1 Tax=Flagellimonas meishanensis TaxID=2873264 RepID=UPI001CA6E776